jgi:hypothetical protein
MPNRHLALVAVVTLSASAGAHPAGDVAVIDGFVPRKEPHAYVKRLVENAQPGTR